MAATPQAIQPATSTPTQGAGAIIGNYTPPPQKTYTQAYQEAYSNIAPTLEPYVGKLQGASDKIGTDTTSLVDTYKSEIPFEQNIYTDMAKTLAMQADQQTGQIRQNETTDVGKQKAAAAASGLDTTTGFTAAQARNTIKGFETQVTAVAEQYAVNADQLLQEANKGISELMAEAEKATIDGDKAQADILGQIVNLKTQEASLATSAAGNILSAQTQDEAKYWQQVYQSGQLDLKQQQIDLTAQTMANKSSGGGSSSTKYSISDATNYGKGLTNPVSNADVQKIFNNGVSQGKTKEQINEDIVNYSLQQKTTTSTVAPGSQQSSGGFDLGSFFSNLFK